MATRDSISAEIFNLVLISEIQNISCIVYHVYIADTADKFQKAQFAKSLNYSLRQKYSFTVMFLNEHYTNWTYTQITLLGVLKGFASHLKSAYILGSISH